MGYLHPRTEEYALSRWWMVAYYVALIVIGVASLTLDAVGAVAFGAGYAVTSTAGLVWRVRRMPHQESWAIVALAILSAGQGAALWAGHSPDGGVEHLLAAVRMAVVAPLMMIEHARLLQRLPRRTDVRL